MAGLGSVSESNGTFLSIAGGFIWNRKAGEDDPDFAKQEYVKADKSTGSRQGAQYADLTGMVTNVAFRTHPEYGESLNVTFDTGETTYIVSISTNNRYSQDFMKCLLKMDLTKELYMKPYDFIGKDKKRAMGISFRQDGEKISLKIEDTPTKEADWFKEATKKEIRRYFEDLTEWYIAEVEEKVCSHFKDEQKEEAPKKSVKPAAEKAKKEEKKEIAKPAVEDEESDATEISPIKMRKALKLFIEENYEDKVLPKLSKEELVVWYNLSLADEELPFDDEEEDSAEVAEDLVQQQLDNLLSKK